MNAVDYAGFLRKKSDRSIATILSFKDREVNGFLPADVSAELREVILDEINSFCESAIQVATGSINDFYVDKMKELVDRMEDLVYED